MYESKKLKKFVVDYVTEYVANATNLECGEDPHNVIGKKFSLDTYRWYQVVSFDFDFLVELYKEAYKTLHVRQLGARLEEHLFKYLIEGTERVYGCLDESLTPYVTVWTRDGYVDCMDGSSAEVSCFDGDSIDNDYYL